MPCYGCSKRRKDNDPTVSSLDARNRVKEIAQALGIKLGRKIMQKGYCKKFIREHKIEYEQYLKGQKNKLNVG